MVPLHHQEAHGPLEQDAGKPGELLRGRQEDEGVEEDHRDAEQAHEVTGPDEHDDAPAALVAGDPKVPPLVDGEGQAQEEADHVDDGKSSGAPFIRI